MNVTLWQQIQTAAEHCCDDEAARLHLHSAFRLAQELWQQVGGDERIIFAAILLHDIGWHRHEADTLPTRFAHDATITPTLAHEKQGAMQAQKILQSFAFSDAEISAITAIIDGHDSRDYPISHNDKVVKDANTLSRYDSQCIASFAAKRHLSVVEYLTEIESGIVQWFFTDEARIRARTMLEFYRVRYVYALPEDSLRLGFVEELSSLELRLVTAIRREMEMLAINSVREQLIAVREQLRLYLKGRQTIDVIALQQDADFSRLAVQPIGESGYTALIDRKNPCTLFHTDKRIINLPLAEIKRERPPELTHGFFEWWNRAINAEEFHSYYLSKDVNDRIRQKFQYSLPFDVADQQWAVIGVAFLDEFRRPTEIITHELRQSLASLSARLDERVMHPLRALAAGTERIAAGELSYQVNLDVADELGYLAEKFNDMAKHLRAAQEKAQQSEQAVRQLNIELELRVQQRTNELLELNTELEAFSYSVSHDLRAPLRHLIAYAKLLEEQLKPHLDTDSQHYLSALYRAASNMGELVDDLLQFSRVGRNEMNRSRIAMNDVVRDVIDTFKTDIGDRQIEWQVDDLPGVYADSGLMRLVWTNLIGNAIKYTSTRPIATIRIRCVDEGYAWNFIIEDNGVGFDMAYLDKLFGVFQRLHSKEEFEGTGIGLANVRRIVLRHGGTVSAYGELEHGARFSFTLPKRSTD